MHISWSQSRWELYLTSFELVITRYLSFENNRSTCGNFFLFFSTSIVRTLEFDIPSVTIRSRPMNGISFDTHNTKREYSLFWTWQHTSKILSHISISRLKPLNLTVTPVSHTSDVEDFASEQWANNENSSNHTGMQAITPTSFWKNKITDGKSKNHTNTP